MYKIIFYFFFTFLLLHKTSAQEIALTFDDAPASNGPLFSGAERANLILQKLKNENVKQVAFFVITGNINANSKARLQQYVKAGSLLGNHTHTHQSIQSLTVAGYIQDIKVADSLLHKMQGFVPWFRYPFLDEGKSKSARDSIRVALKSLGLTNGYVTIDNYDWYLNSLVKKAKSDGMKINFDRLRSVYINHVWKSILFYDSIAREVLGRSPKHVLLLHENDLTALYIGDLIKHLKSHGWKIVSPAEAYKDPIAGMIPDVLFNGQGRVAAIAREKGIAARDLVQESEDEVYLDELVRREKIFE